jgi:hypothetical protein
VRSFNCCIKSGNDRRLENGEGCGVIVAAYSIGLLTACDQLCIPNIGAITKIYL